MNLLILRPSADIVHRIESTRPSRAASRQYAGQSHFSDGRAANHIMMALLTSAACSECSQWRQWAAPHTARTMQIHKSHIAITYCNLTTSRWHSRIIKSSISISHSLILILILIPYVSCLPACLPAEAQVRSAQLWQDGRVPAADTGSLANPDRSQPLVWFIHCDAVRSPPIVTFHFLVCTHGKHFLHAPLTARPKTIHNFLFPKSKSKRLTRTHQGMKSLA